MYRKPRWNRVAMVLDECRTAAFIHSRSSIPQSLGLGKTAQKKSSLFTLFAPDSLL